MSQNVQLENAPNVLEAKRKAFCDGLVDLAEFYRNNPNIPLPYFTGFSIGADSKQAFAKIVRALGTCKKSFNDYAVNAVKEVGPFSIYVSTTRENICEKVVTGKRIVPAYFAPEREEDIIEWKCPEGVSLLAEALDDPEAVPTPEPDYNHSTEEVSL